MRTANFLGKLINIRPDEWRRLILLYSMALVLVTGLTWGDTIVLAAFLQYVGARYLPVLLIGTAGLSIVSLFIYSAFADRVSNTRVLIGLLIFSGIGILLGIGMLTVGIVKPAYVLIYLVLNAPLFDVFNIHWATYSNGFYDIRAAKRIVPVLSTGGRLAAIISGLSMPLVTKVMSPSAIIGMTLASLAFMGAMAAAMPRLLNEQQRRKTRKSKAQAPSGIVSSGEPSRLIKGGLGQSLQFATTYTARLREGYQHINKSPFLKWMAISTFCLPVLLVLLNYTASSIFEVELKTTVAIANFLGVLSGVSNLVILPFQLFFLSRLITRIGLGKANLIYPFASLISAGSLAIVPGLTTAALAHLDRTALRTAFKNPIENLLYNAVPARVKARTRAFVGGLVVPIATILSSFLLLTPLVHLRWFLPTAILLVAAAYLAGSMMVRKNYGKALVDLLEQEDYSSLALQAPTELEPVTLSPVDAATLVRLEQKLTESTTPERAIFIAQLITGVGGEAGAQIVMQAVRAAAQSDLRASLIDVLVAAEIRQPAARALYTQFLSDPDGRVRLSAVRGLEQILGERDERYLEIAARMLRDPDTMVCLQVLPALISADDPNHRAAGGAALRGLIDSPYTTIRTKALQLIGKAQAQSFIPEIVRSLRDPADDVQIAAAMAAERLANSRMAFRDRDLLLTHVDQLLHDPIERIRLAAVTMLNHFSQDEGPDAETLQRKLVSALGDPSLAVRERAVETLSGAGRRAVPLVYEQLTSEDLHLRKMAALVLASNDPHRYAPLVRIPHIDNILRDIYQNICCSQALLGYSTPAAAILQRALREQNAALTSEIFYLLAFFQDPTAVRAVELSLPSARPEVRANALEAFESLTTPQMTALIAPLFEPGTAPQTLLSLAGKAWGISISTPAEAIRLLLSDRLEPWQRMLAAAALVELSEEDSPSKDNEIAELLRLANGDPDEGVRAEIDARTAVSVAIETKTANLEAVKKTKPLTHVRKLILFANAPMLHSLSTYQLNLLAAVSVEEHFQAGAHIYDNGDAGGAYYVVVTGQVGIMQKKRKGSFTQVAAIGEGSSFGETEFFDASLRTNSAVALEDTLTLHLHRGPVMALARQNPDLALELIRVLSVHLREVGERIAGLTRSHPAELQKLFDQFT